MKTKRFNWLLSVALSVCLVVGVLCGTALAEEGDNGTAEPTQISNETDLKNAFTTGGNYILTQDITLDDALNSNGILRARANIQLDLGGYTITATESECVFGTAVNTNVNLTLSNGTVTANTVASTTTMPMIIHRGTGNVTVNGVTFNSPTSVLVVNKVGGTVNLNHCTVLGGDVITVVRQDGGVTAGTVTIDTITVAPNVKNFISGAGESDSYSNVTRLVDPAATTITVLSGETVTISEATSAETVTVKDNGTLVLKDGIVGTVIVREGGTFTIEGGTAGNVSTYGTTTINGGKAGKVTVYGGSTAINGGETDAVTVSAGNFTMTGGTVNSTSANAITIGSDNAETAPTITGTISGGKVSGTSYGLVVRYLGADGSVQVSGGTFAGNGTSSSRAIYNKYGDNDVLIADGYVKTIGENNSVTVIWPVAEVGGTKYATLADAITAANDGDTVTLLADVELTENVSLSANATLDLNGQTITAGSNTITLGTGAQVIVAKGDTSLNRVLAANSYLVAYTENDEARTYGVSDVLISSPEVFMAGHATTITAQDGTDTDTNLFLTYSEDGVEYVALYNSSTAARIFGGWKDPAYNYGIDTSEQVVTLTLQSGKLDSIRAGSKEGKYENSSLTMKAATINVEGGNVGIVATGWYYCQSVETFTVNVTGGNVGTIYGNGETSYTASTEMYLQADHVPTVDTANINISGGTVGYVYGSGRALTQKDTSANYSMLTKNANIHITGGTVNYVNGGGFNGPEANWGEKTGQDLVTVNTAVITVSGGQVTNLFAGGYNGQWKYTYKLNADGELVFSNYNGTDETTRTVRNIVNSATVNVQDGANITNLYMGGRSYAYVENSVANITGGTIGTMSASGNYGYVASSDANISGGTITTLELVTRNYVGDIDLDVTGGTVTDFYAGMGGAYKNANCNEQTYNISTVAILGDVNVNFAEDTVTNSYLTTGLERADSVTSNVPLTVKTMDLATSGYTGSATTSGNFVTENQDAVWCTTIILASVNESFKPSDASESSGIEYVSALEDYQVVSNDDGVRKLDGPYVAKVGTVYYTSLTDALTAAADGATVTLLADVTVESVEVPVSASLDLNGFTLEAATLYLAPSTTGSLLDSSNGAGLLKVSNGVSLPANNAQLPLYDTANGGYRFFDYTLYSYNGANQILKDDSGNPKFYFTIKVNEQAYALMATGTSGLGVKVTVTWDGLAESQALICTYSDADIQNVGSTQGKNIFYILVKGVQDKTPVTVTPVIENASFTKTGAPITYTAPASDEQ